jgi:hypothetical protein
VKILLKPAADCNLESTDIGPRLHQLQLHPVSVASSDCRRDLLRHVENRDQRNQPVSNAGNCSRFSPQIYRDRLKLKQLEDRVHDCGLNAIVLYADPEHFANLA